jgi:hypothetical protein
MIEEYRARVRAALRNGDSDLAMFLIRIVVGLRICSGEIPVKLKKTRLIVV